MARTETCDIIVIGGGSAAFSAAVAARQAGAERVVMLEKAGEAGQKKRPGKGNGLALMLEIALPDGLGMGEKKPRKHGQAPDGRKE